MVANWLPGGSLPQSVSVQHLPATGLSVDPVTDRKCLPEFYLAICKSFTSWEGTYGIDGLPAILV